MPPHHHQPHILWAWTTFCLSLKYISLTLTPHLPASLSDSLPLDSPMLLPSSHNLVPCQLLWCGFRPVWFNSTKFWMVQKFQFCLEMLHPKASDAVVLTKLSSPRKGK